MKQRKRTGTPMPHPLSIRFSEVELALLRRAADSEQRTVSDVIRSRVFGVPLPAIPLMQDGGPIEVR